MLSITPIYIAIAVTMYSVLSFHVISGRGKYKVSIGDSNEPRFTRTVRAHGNFVEYAPLTLLAMGAAELAGAPGSVIHVAGASLLIGRTLHGYCFLFTTSGMKLRVAGMMLTFFAMWTAAAAGIWAVL
tara:strand:- start:23769 stop:24152 length:384 start_codon:yes stop_codon:yes gene_type:complete